jgi:tetratricopeptide (TPR) repeat protein
VPALTQLTPKQIERHHRLCQRGWRLLEGELAFERDSAPPAPPGWWRRRRLRKALACFAATLSIEPAGWPALYVMGRIHRRLAEWPQALGCLAQAHALEPAHADVAREAGLAALDDGDGATAVRYCLAATCLRPADAALVANLALAYLIAGRISDAEEAIDRAVAMAESDGNDARSLKRLIDDVIGGRRARPTSLAAVVRR